MPFLHALGRCRLLPAVVAVALAAVTVPAAADAAEVTRPFGDRIDVTAERGEVNRVRVSDDGPGFVRIRDDVRLRDSARSCTQLSTFEVRCAVAVAAATAIVLLQGDRDDRAEVASTTKIGIDGGAGNDTYAGGLATGASNVLFRGGAGSDTVTYADATARVSVTLGAAAGSGRAGDRDEIADAETIVGSRFGDELVGTGAAETFRPGQGDDVVHGEGGADRYDMSAARDGADRIFGAGEGDIVHYIARTRSVTATVDAGGADDGEAGERDEIMGVSGVRSGSGADTLRLEHDVDAELDGGAGDDTLVSGSGRDVLVGGAGVDTLRSGGDVDRVVAADADRDTIDCGGDTPDEALVFSAGERSIAGCERIISVPPPVSGTRPGGPRLAPTA
jgi:hypothetical protein